MSGRTCEKHGEWCPNGVCRWCEPVVSWAADIPSGIYKSSGGHEVIVNKRLDAQTGITMYVPRHDPSRCAVCRTFASVEKQ